MKTFSLLIKPASADCNLRCKYCFYLEKSALYPLEKKHRMQEQVLEQMIKSYMQSDQPVYSFGWQGGEPTLMGLDFFKKTVEFQKKHGKRGVSVANGLQTNATLLDDDIAKHFAQYNFLLGCSLDGPAEMHDKYRITPNGSSSHASVIKGIETLKKHSVEFNILTLVSKSNVARPHEVYRYLVDNGFLFHQYIPCVEFDDNGNQLPFSISGEEWGEFLCGIFDEWNQSDCYRVSIRHFDSIITKLVEGTPNVCVMGKNCRQYFVVEYNGDIYPCDFFVDASLKLGNVMDISWEQALKSDVYREFGALKWKLNAACRTCEFLDLCAGDCIKHRTFAGNPAQNLSALCTGWKRFFQHTRKRFEELANEVIRNRQRTAPPPQTQGQYPADIGRNTPCPCGSGAKFKKCCGLTK